MENQTTFVWKEENKNVHDSEEVLSMMSSPVRQTNNEINEPAFGAASEVLVEFNYLSELKKNYEKNANALEESFTARVREVNDDIAHTKGFLAIVNNQLSEFFQEDCNATCPCCFRWMEQLEYVNRRDLAVHFCNRIQSYETLLNEKYIQKANIIQEFEHTRKKNHNHPARKTILPSTDLFRATLLERRGSISAIKVEKEFALINKHCCLCLRYFPQPDLARYLKKTDATLLHWKKTLHVNDTYFFS